MVRVERVVARSAAGSTALTELAIPFTIDRKMASRFCAVERSITGRRSAVRPIGYLAVRLMARSSATASLARGARAGITAAG